MSDKTKNTGDKFLQASAGAVEDMTSDHQPSCVVIEILRNGNIAYISSGLEQITGYKPQETLGRDVNIFIQDLIGQEASKQLWPIISEVLRGGRQFVESQVKCLHPETGEDKVYMIQLEASSESFNRSILFIQDKSFVEDNQLPLQHSTLRSMQILEKGNLFFLRSDINLRVNEVLGDTEKILGISSYQLEEQPEIWLDLLSGDQDNSLRKAFYRLIKKPKVFSKEITFKHYRTSQVRHIHFSAVPVLEGNKLVGWEGFGLDVTSKVNAEIALKTERHRFDSLYQLSNQLNSVYSTEDVASIGLDILLKATNSTAGVVWLGVGQDYRFKNSAIKGYGEENVGNLNAYLEHPNNTARVVCERQYGIVSRDFVKDAASYGLECLIDDVASSVIFPIIAENSAKQKKTVGCIVLSSDQFAAYSNSELDLLSTAANLIAAATIRTEYRQAELKRSKNISTLFQLSKNLNKSITNSEIAESTFSVIEEILPFKRAWFGVMNDSGSHISGVSGKGPGMRAMINEVQIDLDLRHDFLDQVLLEKRPMIVDGEEIVECSGLNQVMKILSPSSILILPLTCIGQVSGILIIEPQPSSGNALQENLHTLTTLSNEVASALMTRRFELQISKNEKMKMVDVLTGGIAHNFNNLLQAIMGQASLIQAQLPEDSPHAKPLDDIVEYASRGSGLVKKMGSHSKTTSKNSRVLNFVELIKFNLEELSTGLSSNIKLASSCDLDKAVVFGNQDELLEVVAEVIKNADESLKSEEQAAVSLRIVERKVSSHEVANELTPGQYYRIDIIDNGVGMDQEQINRCFEPFYTTKNKDSNSGVGYSASGLGLSNAYDIIKAHGGIIVASSRINQGSTFSIYLPKYQKEKTSVENYVDKAELKKSQLLVLGEIQGFSVKTLQYFQQLNYQVYNIENRAQMLGLMSKTEFSPKLLILDLDRYGADIADFIGMLQDRYLNIEVVCLTSDVKVWESQLHTLAMVHLIQKPFEIIKLHQILLNINKKSANTSLIEQVQEERSKVIEKE